MNKNGHATGSTVPARLRGKDGYLSFEKLLFERSRTLIPPANIDVATWAEKHRVMSASETAYVGRFSFRLTPWWRWFLERWSQPDVKKGVAQKCAQAGWTQSVIVNTLAHNIAIRRTTSIAMFPKEGSARNFDLEKFMPMVNANPAIAAIIPPASRARGQKILFKHFNGGFIKFVGSNSISDVKSTSAKLLIIEEPDDCNLNLRGQGDAIKLLEERGKTFRDVKILVGGTPSVKGVSSIEDEMLHSDQNYWHVPCPACGEFQRLEWSLVKWPETAEIAHPVYGRADTQRAAYCCRHCGVLWNDDEKNNAVRRGKAVPSAPFRGVLGLHINELYAPWYESRLQSLVERYLTAKHEESKGNMEALIVFYNAALGEAWEFNSDAISENLLVDRGLDYRPLTVPRGGLILTAGVDVQHDRLAVCIRAWGRDEESWLVFFDELDGNPVDKGDEVWSDLDDLLYGTYRHDSGADLRIRAATIDSGDGATAESVYEYIRARRGRGVDLMAGKGSSAASSEIYRRPALSIDSAKSKTKAAKFGLRTYMVGVGRAKDVILGDRAPGRLALEGNGPGRMHWYRDVRSDYIDQMLAEVKVPVRGRRGLRVWELKKGRRNEALDAEIYALHAARSMKAHLMREAGWAAMESALTPAEKKQAILETKPQDMTTGYRSRPLSQKRTGNWITGFRD